ncbi:hypothetical protein FB567DRAFT_34460 [Paraphoma chrysanthemicola]|uniref:Uncharacterized protein n=1 Tax=Paraphoma chrysanthemicola TaxID=798071 RepID=A0A8K0W5V3_9PLEO|nr:hypothetical protein FB567DRAFT_34460 [Paraphoma chrysanthemicola]
MPNSLLLVFQIDLWARGSCWYLRLHSAPCHHLDARRLQTGWRNEGFEGFKGSYRSRKNVLKRTNLLLGRKRHWKAGRRLRYALPKRELGLLRNPSHSSGYIKPNLVSRSLVTQLFLIDVQTELPLCDWGDVLGIGELSLQLQSVD